MSATVFSSPLARARASLVAARGWIGAAARVARRRALEIEEFALPQRCPGCGVPADPDRLLCDSCRERAPRLTIPLCVRCLARERDPSTCSSHPGFQLWAAWVYDERVAAMVQAFKFGGRRRLAGTLSEALAEALPMDYRPDLILEVPLHPVRRRERGYDQAALLADQLARRLRVPRLEGGLERTRTTPPQSGLGARARRRNLQGAFRVARPDALEGRKVLIVDDVVTTGSTLEACLCALRECGARTRAGALAWAD